MQQECAKMNGTSRVAHHEQRSWLWTSSLAIVVYEPLHNHLNILSTGRKSRLWNKAVIRNDSDESALLGKEMSKVSVEQMIFRGSVSPSKAASICIDEDRAPSPSGIVGRIIDIQVVPWVWAIRERFSQS